MLGKLLRFAFRAGLAGMLAKAVLRRAGSGSLLPARSARRQAPGPAKAGHGGA